MSTQNTTILTVQYKKEDIDQISNMSKGIFTEEFCNTAELKDLIKKHSYFLTILLCEEKRRKKMIDRILHDIFSAEVQG